MVTQAAIRVPLRASVKERYHAGASGALTPGIHPGRGLSLGSWVFVVFRGANARSGSPLPPVRRKIGSKGFRMMSAIDAQRKTQQYRGEATYRSEKTPQPELGCHVLFSWAEKNFRATTHTREKWRVCFAALGARAFLWRKVDLDRRDHGSPRSWRAQVGALVHHDAHRVRDCA